LFDRMKNSKIQFVRLRSKKEVEDFISQL
jgi:hypothetical protein